MGMRGTDTIVGARRGSAGRWIALGIGGGAHRPDEVRDYVATVYAIAPSYGIDPAEVLGQSALETSNWTDGWWSDRLNPAGMGVTGDPVENLRSPTFATGADAAWAQVVHLACYCGLDVPEQDRAKDPRWQNAMDAGYYGIATILTDLNNRWAMNSRYGQEIALRANSLYEGLPDQQPNGGTTPVSHTTTIPGLPGGPLETEYPITVNLIPSSNTRQRSGLTARTPRRSVQHGTGNPNNPNAAAEAQWFVNGADGGTASIHYCTDDTKAVVVLPLSEVSWQAADGAGPGNMNGFSCEMMEANAIWQDFGRRDNLIRITADLMGRTAARLGAAVPEKHFDFNAGTADRHHCPDKLMSTGLWETSYVPKWQAARADELKRMNAGDAVATEYPDHRIAVPDRMEAQGFALAFTKPSRFKCVQGGYFLTYPNRAAPHGVPSPYKAGRVYTLGFSTVLPDGERWLASASGSWAVARNFQGVT